MRASGDQNQSIPRDINITCRCGVGERVVPYTWTLSRGNVSAKLLVDEVSV